MTLESIPRLSVIIPAFNEESTVGEIIRQVREVPISKEIIVIDDGSSDNTSVEVEKAAAQPGDVVKVFTLPVNLGKGAAVRIGYKMARGDIIIIQDADLELNPQEYPKLIDPILDGQADVVYGSRFLTNPRGVRLITKLGNWLATTAFNILYGKKLTDLYTCYKVMRREVAQSLKLRSTRFEIEAETTIKLVRQGARILEVPITYKPRASSQKKIKYLQDGLKYLLVLLKFSFDQS